VCRELTGCTKKSWSTLARYMFHNFWSRKAVLFIFLNFIIHTATNASWPTALYKYSCCFCCYYGWVLLYIYTMQVWNLLEMGGNWDWVKTKFFPLHLIFGYVFVVSGLIVCFLMLLTYLFVWPFNRTLYRKIVVALVYTHWCRKYT